MHPKTPKWLQDILDACDLIVEICSGQTQESFVQDEISRAAIERKFEVIGEALNRISKVDPVTAQRVPECRAIIGFRNVLIHGYDDIDYDRVWHVIRADVPPLRKVVLGLLTEAGPPPDE
jgi:uncharacterized protein with HEPN domain